MKTLRVFLLALLLAAFPLTGLAASVNINTADLSALQQLNGIGPAKAQAILDHRDANGSFGSVDELSAVSGIGARTVEINRELLVVEDPQ